MELSYWFILKAIGLFAFVYLVLGLANVHWLLRLRIIAGLLTGVIILGLGGWNMAKSPDPLGAISIANGNITIVKAILCILLSFLAGFGAYLVSCPAGQVVAPLAAPAGLAFWALNSGDMRILLLTNSTLPQRQALFSLLRWECLFWLLLVAAGWLGAAVAGKMLGHPLRHTFATGQDKFNFSKVLRAGLALAVGVIIATFAIGIFAQDVRWGDTALGTVIGQPGTSQTALAVYLAFLTVAFLATAFLQINYIIPTLSAALVSFLALNSYLKPNVLEQMVNNWPVAYFPRAVCAILPLQMAAFAAIGSITGFWLGVRYLKSRNQSL